MKQPEVDLDLHIYKARIVERLGAGDDRLKVRPIPAMADITETEFLPCFPPLVKGEVINGWAENDDRPDKVEPDIVTIMCNYDFTYGFILGRGNIFEDAGDSKQSFYDSFAFDDFSKYISGRGLGTINYDDIIVQNWCGNFEGDDNNTQGGVAEFYNYKTGDKYIVNSSGSCIIMKKDELYLRVGSPAQNGETDNIFSYIKMTADAIEIKSKNVIIDGESINLGKHLGYLLYTHSTTPSKADGIDLQPAEDITV